MAMVKSSIRMGLRKHEGLSELLGDLNEVLEGTTSPELYATLACLRIDPAGRVEYALEGHHHIAHYRASASELQRLDHRNFPLGLLDGRTYSTDTVAPEPGDLLAVYTDGLNETTDASDAELGHEAIERTVADLAARRDPPGGVRSCRKTRGAERRPNAAARAFSLTDQDPRMGQHILWK